MKRNTNYTMAAVGALLVSARTSGPSAHAAEPVQPAISDEQLILVRDGFDQRVRAAFEDERGKPLERAAKKAPIRGRTSNYVRHYSWSLMDFATRCFVLTEQIEAANDALIENAQHYLDNPGDVNQFDSFHWHSDMLLRLIEQYGSNGTVIPGRLSLQAQSLMMEILWIYAQKYSTLAKADFTTGHTWNLPSSENHSVMQFTTVWHYAKLAKDNPDFRDREYSDGSIAAQQYDAWTAFLKEYCTQRAKKGLFVEEGSDNYQVVTMKGFYNLFDFSDDAVLKQRARHIIDLHWAMWAQEQINGVRGGARFRIYQNGADRHGHSNLRTLGWYYFGIGEGGRPLSPLLGFLTSDYRPPLVVVDLAIDVAGRGRYQVVYRPMGRAEKDINTGKRHLKPEGGGLLAYAWCTPEFILGTPMVAPLLADDWLSISAQNRWSGVIFAGPENARIVPQVRATDDRTNDNAAWSVQSKGSLIYQKLRTGLNGKEMRVWFSSQGLTDRHEQDGWIFVEAPQAYAAVRAVHGAVHWDESTRQNQPRQISGDGGMAAEFGDADRQERVRLAGSWLRCEDEWTPVILEVASKADFADYNSFRAAVLALPLSFEANTLHYRGLAGDVFTFDANQTNLPRVNGQTVDYTPPRVLESPFLKAQWDEGVVTITKDGRTLVLDFKQETIVSEEKTALFEQLAAAPWKEVFYDPGTDDWTRQWTLDGLKARVSNSEKGMEYHAGPDIEDASHAVLWTKQSFEGDIRIDFEYTRLDTAKRAVNIIYFHATGSGEGPYSKDISQWAQLREVPAMRTYFNNLNTYHVSYAANPGPEDYIRARRYIPNKGLQGTDLEPDYLRTGLFQTGVPHQFTLIKKGDDLFLQVRNAEKTLLCHWRTDTAPPLTEGRIGLRQMNTRSGLYLNFRVSSLISSDPLLG